MFPTKKDMIYETLKKEILEGVYEFDERLILSKVAKRFSSSEIPVREAFGILSSDGLLENKPHIGAVVRGLTSKDIENIFEIRIELEGLATRLAVDNLDKEVINRISNIIEDSKIAFKNKDYDLFEKLNIDFHMEIYNQSDNELLIKNIEDLWNNTSRYPSLFRSNDEHIRLSIKEHELILESLKNRDNLEAERSMIKHKIRAGKELLSITQQNFYEKLYKNYKTGG